MKKLSQKKELQKIEYLENEELFMLCKVPEYVVLRKCKNENNLKVFWYSDSHPIFMITRNLKQISLGLGLNTSPCPWEMRYH